MTERNVAVLGAGTWGLVLAQILCQNKHRVTAWDYFEDVIDTLREQRTHPRFEDFRLDESIRLTANLAEALEKTDAAILVVPSTAMRSTCEAIQAAGLAKSVDTWVVCSKGIENATLLSMHEVVADVLGAQVRPRVALLTGPSHAEEVARGLPTTVAACADDVRFAESIQQMFFRPYFRVYTGGDMLGASLGGALKNVIAIAAGVSDGMGFGDNTRAALVTRGLAEIVRVGVAKGADRETFMGLSGLGDLVVTTCSMHSRNHRFGENLALGMTCEEALKEVGMVVEGYSAARSAHELAQKYNVEMPISDVVYRVLYDGLPARAALEALLTREATSE